MLILGKTTLSNTEEHLSVIANGSIKYSYEREFRIKFSNDVVFKELPVTTEPSKYFEEFPNGINPGRKIISNVILKNKYCLNYN